jgi:hypothetical protein
MKYADLVHPENGIPIFGAVAHRPRRSALLQNNCPAWRNHVAWVLVDLGRTGTGKIERIESKPRPGGGSMGIYRLKSADEPNILI